MPLIFHFVRINEIIMFMNKKIRIALVLVGAFAVSSCKNPFKGSGGGDGLSGAISSMQDMSTYLDDATQVEMSKCSPLSIDDGVVRGEYPFLDKGRRWKDSPESQAISEQFDKDYMKPLRKLTLKQSDLEALNCPGYNYASEEERKRFWITFMAAVASAESDLQADQVYHDFDGTYSSGLLQIDYASANRWCRDLAKDMGKASFSHQDMLNPKINLQCGLIMMQRQILGVPMDQGGGVVAKGRPDTERSLFTSKSWYWSVLSPTKGRPKVLTFFRNHAAFELAGFCQRTAVDVVYPDGSTFTYKKDGTPSGRVRYESCDKLPASERELCIESRKKDPENPDSFVAGPDSQLGEQRQTKEESCNLVGDGTRNPKGEVSGQSETSGDQSTPASGTTK